MQLPFWRWSIFLKAVGRLQFLTRAELLSFWFTVFTAVWFVMSTLLSRKEHSNIVEGQSLGTVHIMEGTCSKLRFFFRNEQNSGTGMHMLMYMYMYMCMYMCMYAYVCVCMRVCMNFFLYILIFIYTVI